MATTASSDYLLPKKAYDRFDWENVGEPLTPFVQMVFRGDGKLHSFPDKQNKIYVEDATFSVLDDNGYSSASITLVDPDFVNLEKIFLKAVFFANSLTIGEGCWFVRALWGWSAYTSKHKNDITNYKSCAMHYYMLKDLNYELNDVELRVRVELMDIGHSAFAGTMTDENEPKMVVGKLSGQGVSLELDGKPVIVDNSAIGKAVAEAEKKREEEAMAKLMKLSEPEKRRLRQVSNSTEGEAPKPVFNNILAPYSTKDKDGETVQVKMTIWKAIQVVMEAQGFPVVAMTKDGQDAEPMDEPVSTDGKIIIPATAGFKEAVYDLLHQIKSLPSNDTQPGRHWGVLAGGKFTDRMDAKITIAFGWIPDPPKATETGPIENVYKLARNLVYKPYTKQQIALGYTMINNLSYNWTSRGAMAVGLPPIYGIGPDAFGNMKAWTSEDDWKNREPNAQDILGKPGSKDAKGNPTVKANNLQDLSKMGVEVKFNFDSRSAKKELIDVVAGALVVNMWNFFLSEIVEVTVEIPGDPWLDNTLFYDEKDQQKYSSQNKLVDLYNCYFNVEVYKPGSGGGAEPNPVLTGKYLCLKGCSHHLSEGEYTTTLNLMKCF